MSGQEGHPKPPAKGAGQAGSAGGTAAGQGNAAQNHPGAPKQAGGAGGAAAKPGPAQNPGSKPAQGQKPQQGTPQQKPAAGPQGQGGGQKPGPQPGQGAKPAPQKPGGPQGGPGPKGGQGQKPPQGQGQGKAPQPAQGQGGTANLPAKQAQTTPAKVPQNAVTVAEPAKETAKKVPPAKPRRRHRLLFASFVGLVLVPSIAAFLYLYFLAEDRFASNAAFSVHKEDSPSSVELMGGLSALGVSSTGTPDADILYQFIQSQKMVEAVDAEIDLRTAFGSAYGTDPLFSLDPEASLEDMLDYWDRIVSLVFEADIGLISMEVTAFSPEISQQIAQVVLDESASLINKLSKIARDDAISQAREELDIAGARLKDVRLQMAQFRDIEQIVDPTADIAGQMGVISALQQSLAQAMIRRDLLIGTTRDGDPRIVQAEREIEAIRIRIEDERTKVGNREEDDADALARVVGEYESLVVDREFAEQSYVAALANYDGAVAEARRKSRYLAVHIEPTLAETAIYPQRLTLGALFTGFAFMIWALVMLTLYSIRDRR